MAEQKIDKSRRNFLFGAVRRLKNQSAQGPLASTAVCVETIKAANALYVDEAWEEARQQYKACLVSDKNDPDVRYRLGVCLYRLGRYRQAKLELERALRIRPGHQDSFLYLGLTLVRLHRPEKAVAPWKRYFNPQAVAVQRELNLQTGLIEEGAQVSPERVAQAGDLVG